MLLLTDEPTKSTKTAEPDGPLFVVFADFAGRAGGAE